MQDKYTDEQKAAIYGPAAQHHEYSEGETVQVIDPASGQVLSGDVLYATAPDQRHPLQYFVDCGDGFPHVVQSGDIQAR